MADIGTMKDVYTVAQFVGIPGEAIERFVATLEVTGYELTPKGQPPDVPGEVEICDAKRFAQWWASRNCLDENGIDIAAHYDLNSWRRAIDKLNQPSNSDGRGK